MHRLRRPARVRCNRVKAVALNHIDVWGYRGMAFAKRNRR
jgi:NADPH:quinone reductase-like Zn-dependent oxidoreductase